VSIAAVTGRKFYSSDTFCRVLKMCKSITNSVSAVAMLKSSLEEAIVLLFLF
jgi:hypothetical protein